MCALYSATMSPRRYEGCRQGLVDGRWPHGAGKRAEVIARTALRSRSISRTARRPAFPRQYNRRACASRQVGVLNCFCHEGPLPQRSRGRGGLRSRRGREQYGVQPASDNARLNNRQTSGSLCERARLSAELRRTARLRRGRSLRPHRSRSPALPRAADRQRRHAATSINEQALRLLPRGGYLATCRVRAVPAERLARVVAEAAHNAGVQLRQIEERQRRRTVHLVGMPESSYLKFFLYQVV